MILLAFLTFLLLFVLGCEPSEQHPNNWLAELDSVGFFSLQESSPLCGDCIQFEEIVEFGEADGPNYVEWTQTAVQDGLGRLWLNQRDEIKVFGPSGDFVAEVGRKGQGPLEWSYPFLVHADSSGDIHIFDLGHFRESVVSTDFELRGERRIPRGEIHQVVPLPGSNLFVVNMYRLGSEPPRLPLHIIAGDTVLRSFGEGISADPRDRYKIRREVAVSSTGLVFSAKEDFYEIEVWTEAGDRIGGLEGPQLNVTEVKPTFYDLDENPIPTKIIGLHAPDAVTLIVVIQRPIENWRDYFEERVYPGGQVGIQLRDGSLSDSVYTTQIEVIDLPTRTIIARRNHEADFSGFVWPGLLLKAGETSEGVPRLGFWRLGLNNTMRRP